ncbi:MAG: molybdenum cofactor biosynthesis protein MoaE [Firmicutes bacterium]|nr:molybdenum cofactor biosynthesis protein MoaE [Bacillota bacterium]
MRITVRFFAGAAEAAGLRETQVELPAKGDMSLRSLLDYLGEQFPSLQSVLSRAWCARNEEYVTVETILSDGDVIAVIPPVSGGSGKKQDSNDWLEDVAIVRSPLLPALMHERVTDARAGAVVVFAGTVREFTRGRQTLRLQYEAYEEMATRKLSDVIVQTRDQWPIVQMAIWHRTGTLALSDISVLIGVSTAHRHDAFEAAEYAIKTLKQIVPIWKKEFFADGSEEWVGPDGPWKPIG